jgi:hypothetical protein
MSEYASTLTLREARARYFEENGFGKDGGYGDAWVDFKFGPVPFPFLNTPSRVRAVRYHDLHHVLTGYRTDVCGEFEISAWEIGAGCKSFVAAWGLNLSGMLAGSLVIPRRTFRAFVRGRRSRSFYGLSLETLLEQTVEQSRERMGVRAADDARATALDATLFAAALVPGFVIGFVLFAFGLAALPFGLATLALRRLRAHDAEASAS